MEKINKATKKEEKRVFSDGGGERVLEKYQEDKKNECSVELSLPEYNRLIRRALSEGCTPEELVARRISELVVKGK